MAKTLKKATTKSLFENVARVPIKSIKVHPENPNVRVDIDDVVDSLEEDGLYKPLVVQAKTKYILVGNHTYLAARKLGWTEIDVVMLDIDDTTARRIMVKDNKIGQDAILDDTLVAQLLSKIPDAHIGTGYDINEVDSLLKSINKTIDSAIEEAEQANLDSDDDTEKPEQDSYDGGSDSAFGVEDEDEDDEDGPRIEKASDELPGSQALKDEIPADYVGYWQIPKIRTDMLMTFDEIPKDLETWAGSATKDWPKDDQWWFYNWGVDSTSGMKDISKVILGFYCWDEYFENWWHEPERYVARLINSGVKYAVSPNYSQWPDQPQAANLWSLYRSRWITRYFQECGVKVIPDINWPMGDQEFLEKHVLATLPKKLPLVALQMQTFDKDMSKEDEKTLAKLTQLVFDTLEPKGLLFYAGNQGQKFLKKHVRTNCPVFTLDTRMSKLSEAAKKREKKTTI